MFNSTFEISIFFRCYLMGNTDRLVCILKDGSMYYEGVAGSFCSSSSFVKFSTTILK